MKIKEPQIPNTTKDLQTCIKAQQSEAYAQKVKLSNLKQMAQTVAYIQEHGYDSLEDFHIALDQASDQTSAARKSLKDTEQQLKDVNEQIHFTGQYKFPIFMLSKKRYYIKKRRRYIQMKAHKYWSLGALAAMIGTFYTGYKNMKSAHKYFACSSLLCMIMAIYSGHKMISGKSRKKKDSTSEESAE